MNRPVSAISGKRPLALDFDASVFELCADETRIALGQWREAIRFGCSWSDFSRLEKHLDLVLPDDYGCVFIGNGDFHHLTLHLLRRVLRRADIAGPVDLIVCDNHPDNMRYPFGLHCGSWVSHAAALEGVRHVHVLGICSPDITLAHAWENRLGPFIRRKLTYWSVNARAGWLKCIGRGDFCRAFSTADALIEAFLPVLGRAAGGVYLSIDKDVLGPDVVKTNWDQGVFTASHLRSLITACCGAVVGADICGDVSEYVYAGWFKRFLNRLDDRQSPAPEQARQWRAGHRDMNVMLLELLRL